MNDRLRCERCCAWGPGEHVQPCGACACRLCEPCMDEGRCALGAGYRHMAPGPCACAEPCEPFVAEGCRPF